MIELLRTEEANNPVCIKVGDLSKIYRVWSSPLGRLKNALAEELSDAARWALGDKNLLSSWMQSRAQQGYREVHALRKVSLEIGRGEVVGIIGYNGSGKSTLLQILAGTLTPTSGRVEVHGRIAALLELGAGINPDFTGRENAFLYGSVLGFSREFLARRMHAIEEFAEIGEFMDEPVKTYSTGMVARLAFAVLTQLDPDILIVDETLSVGDAYFQNKSIGLIRRFQEEGKTMLVVSHSPGTIKSMCTRAVILERGAVVREGPADAVCDYYNALVAKKQKDEEIRQVEKERGRVVTRSGNRRIAISDVELLNAKGSVARAFTVGEDARLVCALEFRADVEEPTVGLLIRDRLGNDVFGTNTFHHDYPLGRFLTGACGEVSFSVRLNLAPGRYSVTVAAHSGRDHLSDNYDWQDNVIVFDVLPGAEPAFIGTAWLPVGIELHRNPMNILRSYAWGHLLDFSADGDAVRHKQNGWAVPETQFTWTMAKEAVLRFDFDRSDSDRVLRVRAAGFCTNRIRGQRVQVMFDDALVATWLVDESAEHAATIPAKALAEPGRHAVRFVLPDASAPKDEGLSNDDRLLGIRVFSARFD